MDFLWKTIRDFPVVFSFLLVSLATLFSFRRRFWPKRVHIRICNPTVRITKEMIEEGTEFECLTCPLCKGTGDMKVTEKDRAVHQRKVYPGTYKCPVCLGDKKLLKEKKYVYSMTKRI